MPFRLLCPTLAFVALAMPATSATAADLRELCVDRPGKDTPPCIVDVGHLVAEVGAVQFSRETEEGETRRDYGFAETLVRVGLTGRSEVQLGWTPYNIVRVEDRDTGARRTVRGVGDLTAAWKYNFRNPDGSGTSAAVQAFATAPTGRDEVGSGAWEGGAIIPLSFELSDRWSLAVDPEVDVRGDEDGHGHHLAWVGVASLSRDLGHGLEGSAELWSSFERDPGDHRTEASFDVSLAWIPEADQNLQFDAEVDLGLTHDTPGLEAAIGVAYRF